MKRICLIDSTYPINTRTDKIYQSLSLIYGIENVSVIAWNRDERNIHHAKNFYIFEKKADYGNKIQKLANLIYFRNYIKSILNIYKFDILIASHWETLYLVSKVKGKKSFLIYENLDIPTCANIILLKVLQFIESVALKKTDCIIFASRFFEPLYKKYNGKKIVLENKPTWRISTITKKNTIFTLTFLGVMRYYDILINLIQAVNDLDNMRLKLYGDGPDYKFIDDYITNKNIRNVVMYGHYNHHDIGKIYSESDVIWAVYPNIDYNVKYAISNKFHESLQTFKPCIYANKTELGTYVEKNHIGFTVDPYSVEDIKKTISNLMDNRSILDEISNNLKKINYQSTTWEDDFKKIQEYIDKII